MSNISWKHERHFIRFAYLGVNFESYFTPTPYRGLGFHRNQIYPVTTPVDVLRLNFQNLTLAPPHEYFASSSALAIFALQLLSRF